MNEKIIEFIRNKINSKGMTFAFVSRTTNIEYQRLIRLFSQNATISASELLCLSKFLEIDQSDLMSLLPIVA